MKVSESLEAAKKKITNSKDWFPGMDRCDENMRIRFAHRQCNCALTAFEKDSDNYYKCLYFLRKAIQVVDPSVDGLVIVSVWNDSATHENVMKAYDVAIDLAKEDECPKTS